MATKGTRKKRKSAVRKHSCTRNFQPTEFPIYDERVKGFCRVCGRKMQGYYR